MQYPALRLCLEPLPGAEVPEFSTVFYSSANTEVIIGRGSRGAAPEPVFQLDRPTCSRRHLLLRGRPHPSGNLNIVVEDLSTFGTYLNGQRLPGRGRTPSSPTRLRDGDELSLGESRASEPGSCRWRVRLRDVIDESPMSGGLMTSAPRRFALPWTRGHEWQQFLTILPADSPTSGRQGSESPVVGMAIGQLGTPPQGPEVIPAATPPQTLVIFEAARYLIFDLNEVLQESLQRILTHCRGVNCIIPRAVMASLEGLQRLSDDREALAARQALRLVGSLAEAGPKTAAGMTDPSVLLLADSTQAIPGEASPSRPHSNDFALQAEVLACARYYNEILHPGLVTILTSDLALASEAKNLGIRCEPAASFVSRGTDHIDQTV